MKDLFKKYSLELEDSEIVLFENFLKIFKEKNAQINLSAIREDEAIIEKHFIDSIMLNAFLDFTESSDNNISVLDLGTGWWFPLIPLAIINPKVQFTGLDSVWKKLAAIEDFSKKLWLTNITTLNWRAEEVWQQPQYREEFDFVVSRATAFLPVLLEYTIPLLKTEGIFIAYKLEDKEELKASKKALSRLSAKILKVKNYTIDWQKRTLLFIQKLHPTHKKYPRKVWVPLQRPL